MGQPGARAAWVAGASVVVLFLLGAVAGGVSVAAEGDQAPREEAVLEGGYRLCADGFSPCTCGVYRRPHSGAHRRDERHAEAYAEQQPSYTHHHGSGRPQYEHPPSSHKHGLCCCPGGGSSDLCVRNAVDCSAGLDLECQTPGNCAPANGTCGAPTNTTYGTPCSAGRSCQDGRCTDLCVRNGVDCSAGLDLECQTPGTCAPANGTCSPFTNRTNGFGCSVGTCQDGSCAANCTGQPSTVANLTWACPSTAVGGSCKQQCDLGSAGRANATCSSAGVWDSPAGACRVPKVLLLHADLESNALDVQTKLNATGAFAAVDTWNAASADDFGLGTPNVTTLQGYDAVLAWSGGSWGNATAIGDLLAEFWNGGGGVVTAVLANVLDPDVVYDIRGAWAAPGGYQLITPAAQEQPTETLPLILIESGPLVTGVANLTAQAAFRSTGTLVFTGTNVVAQWGSGTAPLIVRATKPRPDGSTGNLVELNMFPPSNDAQFASGNFWVGEGANIMRNALLFSITDAAP